VLARGVAPAVDGNGGAEKDLERQAVADQSFAQRAVRVGVAVDQARREQAICSIHDLGVLRRRARRRRRDAAYRAVLDENVGKLGAARLDVEHAAAANNHAFHDNEKASRNPDCAMRASFVRRTPFYVASRSSGTFPGFSLALCASPDPGYSL